MSDLVASGTVRVRDMSGHEWDEIVEVFEEDLDDTNGETLAPEDVACRVAQNQCVEWVETLECDLS
jgi:hypothetical protein